MKNNFIGILGWYGVLAILGAYALISFSLLTPNSLSYQLLNLTGAAGIVLEAYSKKDYQPVILNIIWIMIALATIMKIIFF